MTLPAASEILTGTGDIAFGAHVGLSAPLGDVVIDPRHVTAPGTSRRAAGGGLDATGDISIDTNVNITGSYARHVRRPPHRPGNPRQRRRQPAARAPIVSGPPPVPETPVVSKTPLPTTPGISGPSTSLATQNAVTRIERSAQTQVQAQKISRQGLTSQQSASMDITYTDALLEELDCLGEHRASCGALR